MIEVMEHELRMDDKILRNVTDEEMSRLRELTKIISRRAGEEEKRNTLHKMV